MNNFIFENSTKAFFGKGCVKEYLTCISSHFGKRVMLAYGGGSIIKNGIYGHVRESLEKAEKTVIDFGGIMANPTYKKVQEGIKIARENKVDLILAVGGGSVMDCCKAIATGSVYKGDLWQDFFAERGCIDFSPLPLGVIVTVTGTGSEMNGGAVITNEELHVKTGRDYPECSPKFALMDPTYTFTVGKMQTAAGGFDILSHIMEIFFSYPDADNVSDDISLALMKSVVRNLRAALLNPTDYMARSNLMWASSMAENRIIKLGKNTDFQCHNMEHQLGAFTDCNHGQGLGVLHPPYYRRLAKVAPAKFALFAREVWGVSDEGKSEAQVASEGVESLAGFIKDIGLPTTLRELGIAPTTDLKAIADSCGISQGSYIKMTNEKIYEIFKECL